MTYCLDICRFRYWYSPFHFVSVLCYSCLPFPLRTQVFIIYVLETGWGKKGKNPSSYQKQCLFCLQTVLSRMTMLSVPSLWSHVSPPLVSCSLLLAGLLACTPVYTSFYTQQPEWCSEMELGSRAALLKTCLRPLVLLRRKSECPPVAYKGLCEPTLCPRLPLHAHSFSSLDCLSPAFPHWPCLSLGPPRLLGDWGFVHQLFYPLDVLPSTSCLGRPCAP